jgi:Cd2+/Zn2+-exporting ATPase
VLAPLKTSVVTGEGAVTAIRIMQMDCPTEENLIQNKLGGMKTVKSLDFNLMQRVLTVVHEPAALEDILTAIRSLGFKPEVQDSATSADAAEALPEPKKAWWPLALAGVLAFASEAVDWFEMPEALSKCPKRFLPPWPWLRCCWVAGRLTRRAGSRSPTAT